MQSPPTQQAHLVRQIGLASGIAIVVGSMIGSGIFRSPADIAGRLPGPLPMMMVWVAGGIVALCGALTLAEVGGAFPYSGGLYVFIREAFGRLPAFLFGWGNLLTQPASNGALAIVFSQYALRLFGLESGEANFTGASVTLSVAALFIVTVANVVGVKFGAGIQNITTLAKVGGLLTLIVLAAVLEFPKSGGHFTPAAPAGSYTPTAFGLALISALFAYDGWMTISYVGGEVANPRRTLPRAIILGVGIVTLLYCSANLAYLTVFSVQDVAKSPIIAADSMAKMIGPIGMTFIIGTVMLSTFGALNSGMLTNPRIYYAMSEDRVLYEPLARVHPAYKTPYLSIILSGVQSVLYVFVATAFTGSKAFNTLIDACVVGNLPFYALAVASVLEFRGRERRRAKSGLRQEEELDDSLVDVADLAHQEARPHRYSPPMHTPLYPIPPLIFVAATLILIGNSLTNPESSLASFIVLGAIALGIPVYHWLRKVNQRQHTIETDPSPSPPSE